MTPLREVVTVFLRLGLVAFGGPAAALARAGVHELLVLFGVGGLTALALARSRPAAAMLAALACATPGRALAAAAAAGGGVALGTMTLVFLKIGAVLYGSGYVLLAFLRADFVERLGRP